MAKFDSDDDKSTTSRGEDLDNGELSRGVLLIARQMNSKDALILLPVRIIQLTCDYLFLV